MRKWSNPFAIINQTGAGSIWQPMFFKGQDISHHKIYVQINEYILRGLLCCIKHHYQKHKRSSITGGRCISSKERSMQSYWPQLHDVIARTFFIRLCNILFLLFIFFSRNVCNECMVKRVNYIFNYFIILLSKSNIL